MAVDSLSCSLFGRNLPFLRVALRFAPLLILPAGCGGAGVTSLHAPPPSPDFALSVSPSSVTISQGSTSSPIQISVRAVNGFSGTVQVNLSGLPAGINANPSNPFSISSGASETLLLGVGQTVAAGNVAITAQATSGNLTHSADLDLTVESSVPPQVSRSAYLRTDAISTADGPAGEPRHRHIVYDAANHHLIVANAAANRVEVASALDASLIARIDVPGVASVDLSADGKTIYAGTTTSQIAAIDSASLQVVRTWQLAGIRPAPAIVFDRPEEVTTLAGGRALVRLRQATGSQALLTVWNPDDNSLNDLTASAPQLFQNGVGVISRSGDHSHVLVASNDGGGTAALYDASGNIVVAPKALGYGEILSAAGNGDGSQFAVVVQAGGGNLVLLLDEALNIAATHIVNSAQGITFAHDGGKLYVTESLAAGLVVSALAAGDLHVVGETPDLTLQGIGSTLEEAGENGLLFGLGNRGVVFLDTSQNSTLPPALATFSEAPAVFPESGPLTGATPITLTGKNFGAGPIVRVGTQFAASVSGSTPTQIQATTPASIISGAMNVTAYFQDGTLALAPDSFSYGPQVLEVLPNTGGSPGGDTIAVYGYGFGQDASKVQVKFGQRSASVQKIENVQAVRAVLKLDADYPFPLQRAILSSPSGSAGESELVLTTPAGSTAVSRGFQYLKKTHVYPKANFYKFISYDRKRKWVYASDIDHVDVFDTSTEAFTKILTPPGGPSPNSLLRQTALTPDGDELALTDFGAQSVYLVNPDTAIGTKVFVGGIPGNVNSGPVRVTATSRRTLFVGLGSYVSGFSGCQACLQQMDLTSSPATVEAAPQPEVSVLTGAPMLDSDADGNSVYFSCAAAPGQPMASWSAAAPQQFMVKQTGRAASDIAAASDGHAIALRIGSAIEIRDQDLNLRSVTRASELEGVPTRTDVPGIALHPSGALVYLPFLTGPPPVSAPFTGLQGGVDIVDGNTGRLRIRVFLPEPFAMLAADSDGLHGRFLAIDETGAKLFAITPSGLTVVELAHVPLGFGSVSPNNANAGTGPLTIQGSGFQPETTVMVGTKSANVDFVDVNTLKITLPASLSLGPQRLTIANPGGEVISIDGAVSVN